MRHDDDDERQPQDLAEWYGRAKAKLATDRENMVAWIDQVLCSYWYLEQQRIEMQALVTTTYDQRARALEEKHASMARDFEQALSS